MSISHPPAPPSPPYPTNLLSPPASQARKERAEAAALAEWERENGEKKDKYSDIRVDRHILVQIDQELERQQKEVRVYVCVCHVPYSFSHMFYTHGLT